MFFGNDGCDIVVDKIDFFTEERHVLGSLVVGDKATQLELGRALTTDVLGQAYATGHRAINQYAHGVVVDLDTIMNVFYKDSDGPHQEGGDDEGDDCLGLIETCQCADLIVFEYQGQDDCKGH